eukprot:1557460-Rhodomonas_salina.1
MECPVPRCVSTMAWLGSTFASTSSRNLLSAWALSRDRRQHRASQQMRSRTKGALTCDMRITASISSCPGNIVVSVRTGDIESDKDRKHAPGTCVRPMLARFVITSKPLVSPNSV